MPLDVRSIAVNVAVACFFIVGFVGWAGGHQPFSCCKKAVAAAFIAYLVATCAIKAINAVLLNAITSDQLNKQKEKPRGAAD
jgi:uncharacterized membrane protein YjjP (DUF1212 family)